MTNDDKRIEELLDLLARTIPALSMAIDLADTGAHRESRRTLMQDVELAIGRERIKAQLLTGDAHFVASRAVTRAHLKENGEQCSWNEKRYDAARAIMTSSSFLACPECGIVLKDRNGQLGRYDHDFVWRGCMGRDHAIEFEYTRAGNFYSRVHGGSWDCVSGIVLDTVTKYLAPLINAPKAGKVFVHNGAQFVRVASSVSGKEYAICVTRTDRWYGWLFGRNGSEWVSVRRESDTVVAQIEKEVEPQ